jgi:hypothetical protein
VRIYKAQEVSLSPRAREDHPANDATARAAPTPCFGCACPAAIGRAPKAKRAALRLLPRSPPVWVVSLRWLAGPIRPALFLRPYWVHAGSLGLTALQAACAAAVAASAAVVAACASVVAAFAASTASDAFERAAIEKPAPTPAAPIMPACHFRKQGHSETGPNHGHQRVELSPFKCHLGLDARLPANFRHLVPETMAVFEKENRFAVYFLHRNGPGPFPPAVGTGGNGENHFFGEQRLANQIAAVEGKLSKAKCKSPSTYCDIRE